MNGMHKVEPVLLMVGSDFSSNGLSKVAGRPDVVVLNKAEALRALRKEVLPEAPFLLIAREMRQARPREAKKLERLARRKCILPIPAASQKGLRGWLEVILPKKIGKGRRQHAANVDRDIPWQEYGPESLKAMREQLPSLDKISAVSEFGLKEFVVSTCQPYA